MATTRKRKVIREPRAPLEGVAVEVPDEEDDEDPAEMELQRVVQELGGHDDTSLTIKKVSANKEEAHCFQCAPSDFSIDQIREQWGPGAYRIYGYRDGHIAIHRKLVIAQPLEKPRVETPAFDAMGLVRELSTRMEQAQTKMMGEMQRLLLVVLTSNKQSNQVDPLVMQNNLLEQMVKMKALTGDNGKSNGLEMLLAGIELARDLGGPTTGAETNDILMELVRKFGPPLAEITMRGHRAAAEPATPAAGQPALAVVQKKVQPKKGGNEMLKLVGMLVNGAENGTDPISYADLIFDQVSVEQIQAFFAMGDPVATLEKLDPRVKEHREWFEQLRGYLAQGLQEASEPGDNAPSNSEAATVETEQRSDKDLPAKAVGG